MKGMGGASGKQTDRQTVLDARGTTYSGNVEGRTT
jgi:hypothetical protein